MIAYISSMKKINLIQAMGLLLTGTSNGRIFKIQFEKKDGTIRNMACRRGVNKGVTGNGLKYNPLEKALMPVFDMVVEEFRTIKSFSMNGQKYQVI